MKKTTEENMNRFHGYSTLLLKIDCSLPIYYYYVNIQFKSIEPNKNESLLIYWNEDRFFSSRKMAFEFM